MRFMSSTNTRTLHWMIAVFVILALATGKAATFAAPADIDLLRLHLAFGFLAGLLSVLRLAVWFTAGPPPSVYAVSSGGLKLISKLAHGLLRLTPVILLASGIGTLVISGSLGLILAGIVPDPEVLAKVPPRNLHHLAANILMALLGLHVAAAIWHRLAGHQVRPETPAQ